MDNPETAGSGAILVYYLISSLIASLQPSKSSVKISQHQQICLLITTALVLGVSLGLCALQAIHVGRIGRHGNDHLLSDLLFALLWLVLLLAHMDHPENVQYPHYGAWGLSILLRTLVCFHRLNGHDLLATSIGRGIAALTLCQPIAAVGLLLVRPLFTLSRRGEASDKGETQPLLESSDADGQSKADEEEQNSRESPEQKKAREEIHNRPIREYLRSFLIYVPLLWPQNSRQKLYFGGMCVCMLLGRLINILLPLALGLIIDTLARGDPPWLPIAGYFALYFAESKTGIGLLEDFFRLMFTNQQTLTVNRAAYNHIMDLSADFQDSKTSSEVWQAMTQAASVISLSNDLAFSLAPKLLDFAAGFILLWGIFGPYMGVIVLNLMVLMIWTSIRAVHSRVSLSRTWRDSWYDSYHQLVDTTENWYTVSQFDQVPREKSSYQAKQLSVLQCRNQLYYWHYRTGVSRYSILAFAYLLAAALAAYEIHTGELQVGAFITLTGYWAQVASPIMYIVHEITTIADKLVDAEKLLVLLEKKPTIYDEPNAKEYEYKGGAVEFKDVSFTYDGKKQATEGLSFEASSGTMTALVGETGGGKSTILKLLMRFYDPEDGKILIDGQEISQVQLESLRKHIGVVPQEPSMFHTTILDNVRYPDPTLSEEAVQEACKAVALHDKIMTFTKGYQTKVGERGCQLSGGEKQRLAIARAILKKPDILLLDEATSSVDSVTEGHIQDSLDRVCKGRTTFVIAHRLSTILKADLILVIEGGRLVEKGSHSELIQNVDGAYNKLWKSQLKLQDRKRGSRSGSSDEGDKDALTLINASDGAEDKDGSIKDETGAVKDSDKQGEEKSAHQSDGESAPPGARVRRRNQTCSEANGAPRDDDDDD